VLPVADYSNNNLTSSLILLQHENLIDQTNLQFDFELFANVPLLLLHLHTPKHLVVAKKKKKIK